MAQLPLPPWKENLERGLEVLVRSDSARASHEFLDQMVSRGLEFSVGLDLTEPVRQAVLKLSPKSWEAAITKELEGAEVPEITGLLDLSRWPLGSRVVVRREEPHPEASYNLFDPQGLRHQAMITNTQDPDIAYLEARQRLHARGEDRIKDAKDCGRANFPCHDFRANQVWLLLVQLAQNLLCWAQHACRGPDCLLARP